MDYNSDVSFEAPDMFAYCIHLHSGNISTVDNKSWSLKLWGARTLHLRGWLRGTHRGLKHRFKSYQMHVKKASSSAKDQSSQLSFKVLLAISYKSNMIVNYDRTMGNFPVSTYDASSHSSWSCSVDKIDHHGSKTCVWLHTYSFYDKYGSLWRYLQVALNRFKFVFKAPLFNQLLIWPKPGLVFFIFVLFLNTVTNIAQTFTIIRNKHIRCALDLNLGPQNGKCTQIHWAMAPPCSIFLYLSPPHPPPPIFALKNSEKLQTFVFAYLTPKMTSVEPSKH